MSFQTFVTFIQGFHNAKKTSKFRILKDSVNPAGIYLLKVNNKNTRTKVWNMFRVNNKDTRMTPMTYFTPCSHVSIINFEHVIAGCEIEKIFFFCYILPIFKKGVLKTCSKFTGKQPCQSVISIKLLSNLIEITLRQAT